MGVGVPLRGWGPFKRASLQSWGSQCGAGVSLRGQHCEEGSQFGGGPFKRVPL